MRYRSDTKLERQAIMFGVVKKRKNRYAVALGRRGGKKGGPARAANMMPEERSESARNAVRVRWAKVKGILPGADTSAEMSTPRN